MNPDARAIEKTGAEICSIPKGVTMVEHQELDLPELKPCSRIVIGPQDAIIVSAGFENRTLAFDRVMQESPLGSAIVVTYLPYDEHNRAEDVIKAIEGKGIVPDIVVYDRYEPVVSIELLRSSVGKLKEAGIKTLVIDISAMSKLLIMIALLVAEELDMAVDIFYAEAEQYRPSKKEYEEARRENNILRPSLQLYSGIEDVVRIRELSSVSMQGQPSCLVAFMSFNEKFVQALLNRINPSRLLLINGKPPCHSWREEATAWIHKKVIEEWANCNPVDGKGALALTASTLDYRESLEILTRIYWKYFTSHKLLLAPSGSKMQAIGCYLFRSAYYDVQVEYPTAKGYLDEYSTGIGKMWLLSFGEIGAVVRKIRAFGIRNNLMINRGDWD